MNIQEMEARAGKAAIQLSEALDIAGYDNVMKAMISAKLFFACTVTVARTPADALIGFEKFTNDMRNGVEAGWQQAHGRTQ